VVTGAEKVKDSTRQLWEKSARDHSRRLWLHGMCAGAGLQRAERQYASARWAGCCRESSIGWSRLKASRGREAGGAGPNVMLGYMFADAPGVIQPPAEGWYDTGDIVDIDADGFITIKGRAKRFAKLGGEMVSLAAVETLASDLWPGATHVGGVAARPRKGEQIVLVTDKPDADRQEFLAFAKREQHSPELYVPRAVLVVANIPVLGSGKIDYPATVELVKTMRSLI
jgi:acyl-[acyl-carrier-protein]-phospholipid O-acyltransferase/long-chain-fatty-acid--[acyl-carrier-protein] ligase